MVHSFHLQPTCFTYALVFEFLSNISSLLSLFSHVNHWETLSVLFFFLYTIFSPTKKSVSGFYLGVYPTFSSCFYRSEVAQSWPTLYDRMYCSLPGSSVHGIFQARVLEWVAVSFFFSRGSSHPGIKPGSPALHADTLPSEPPGKPCFYRKRQNIVKSMDFGVRKKSTHSLLCHCNCVTLNISLKIFQHSISRSVKWA